MSFMQESWSGFMVLFAVVAIAAIFYLAWRLVIRAKKGNRSVRRAQTTPPQRDEDTRA